MTQEEINNKLRNNNMGFQQYRDNVADVIEEIDARKPNWNEDSDTSNTFIQNKPSIKKGSVDTSVTVGSISGNEEDINKATKSYAIAEGQGTIARALYAHAEGKNTIAGGENSDGGGGQGAAAHAEGARTQALGTGSHAEGGSTVSRGNYSHAEGDRTIAAGQSQHVEGVGNIEDINSEFIHIIGNGWTDETGTLRRSNAHTVDWSGNAWYQGDIRIGQNKSRLISEEERAIDTHLKVIQDSNTGAWIPTFDNTNPEAQDKVVINANEIIEFLLPEKIELKFSVASDNNDPVTFIVYEGGVNITPNGSLTLSPNYPLEFAKGKELRSYKVEVSSGTLKIFNLIGGIAGLVAPGGDVNLINGIITIKDEIKESLGGTKIVTRAGTKIGYTSEDELLCNTKYYYTEALDMVYFRDDLFKGSGENGAKQIGDEWEINFSMGNGFSISSETYIELNIAFPELRSGYIVMRIKYAGNRYVGYIELHETSSVE